MNTEFTLRSAGLRMIQSRAAERPSRRRAASPQSRRSTDLQNSSCADPSSEWILLHHARLPRVSAHDAVATLELSNCRWYIDARGLQALSTTEGTAFHVPCVTELCELRLANATHARARSGSIKMSMSEPDRTGAVTVSVYANLRQVFADLSTSRSSDFSWRLSFVAPRTISASIDGGTNAKLFGINSLDVDGIGEASTPSEFKLPLLPHQCRSLAWMIKRETTQELCVHERHDKKKISFAGVNLWLDLQAGETFSLCGGMLCDVVGSGKTATVLALVCCQDRGKVPLGIAKATLVMCPPNVHAQWLSEVEKICPHLHTVPLRTQNDLEFVSHDLLRKSDLVVVPYELFNMPGVAGSADALKDLRWCRVVLDEFQELCSGRSTTTKACSRIALNFLKAERWWGLSGTPESFLHSASEVVNAASFVRCDINCRTAPVFVEHFCRQARVSIPVEVHEHVVRVRQTPAERTLYLQERSHFRYFNLAHIKHDSNESARVQRLLLLSSHFLPNDDSDSPARDSNLSADEVCAMMFHSKKAALVSANARFQDLSIPQLLEFVIAVETMDQNIGSAFREMARHEELAKESSASSSFPDKNDRAKLATSLSHSRKKIRTPLKIIKAWCLELMGPDTATKLGWSLKWCYLAFKMTNQSHKSEQVDLELLDVISVEVLLELCGAVDKLHRHSSLPPIQDTLEVLRRLQGCCDCIVNAQRDLDYFTRTWDAFQAGSTSCPVCFEKMDPHLGNFLFCGHAICVYCAPRLNDSRCPICRSQVPEISGTIVPKQLSDHRVVPARQVPKTTNHLSSKLSKMLEILRDIQVGDAGAKVLVFSQWNSLRQHVLRALCDAGVKHLSLEGNIFERARILQQFQSDPRVSLLLLSLEDSASGTNLTVASHVFLLHPMLASSEAEAASFESQAIGRVRRLGQTRPVHVWRFMTLGTLEESFWEECNSRSAVQTQQ